MNCKFFVPVLALVFILSFSAVSADTVTDEDSLALFDNDGQCLNGNLEISNSADLECNALSNDGCGSLSSDVELVGGEGVSLSSDVKLVEGAEGDSSNDISLESTENGSYGSLPLESADDGSSDEGNENDIDDNGTDVNETNTTMNTSLKIVSQSNWKIYGPSNYTVKLLDEDSNPIAKAKIQFKIRNPKGTYSYKTALTDVNGIACLPLNFNLRGSYIIQVSYAGDSDYNPAESVDSKVFLYEKTVIRTSTYAYRSSNLAIKLYSRNGYYIAKKRLVIYLDGKRYVKTTDSKGRVLIKMPSNKRLVKLDCSFSSSDYYTESKRSMKLPVYKRTYTKPLVYAILKGKNFKVQLKGTDGKVLKRQKLKITINGKTYTKVTNKKGIAYLKVSLRRNEYNVSLAYGNNSIYGPSKNSSILTVIDSSGQFKKGLNQNTKLSPYQYLYGGGKASVGKYIRKLSKRITGKYSTKLEKANAIYCYVRDNLNYEYYPNSRKGAYKTIKSKAGNCCDHSNLIVALCRASNIPARYAHAQGCRFIRSGSVEGHVWAQIYVGGRWYSADATSYRNSLGHINNWNTKSYNSLHIYRNIPF